MLRKIKIFTVVYAVVVLLLAGCSTSAMQDSPAPAGQSDQTVRQLQITNHSSAVVNAIKYKPCNAATDVFLTLAENLKPKERVVFNLYDVCIDLKALNTFEDTLEEKNNLSLSEKGVWDIRSALK